LETGRVEARESRREVGGVEIACRETGQGPAVLLIHETATGAAVWQPLADALAEEARAIAYDRRGWGESGAPHPYERTTVEEQAEDAVGLLESFGEHRVAVCGAGLGAVIALDLILRRPGMVSAALLIEPPLLAFLSEATEGVSADSEAISEQVRERGPAAGLDLYLGGRLPFLGAGAERIPATAVASSADRPLTLFAEIGAVPGWPIRRREMRAVAVPTRIVTGTSTPPLLRRCAEELAGRLGASEALEVECGEGLPHSETGAGALGAEVSRLCR
jgi:pimeloyl-ACP methyl ester carboxylesterase